MRGTESMPYSAQKAELESVLSEEAAGRGDIDVYVFRPSIVAGPQARALVEAQPYVQANGCRGRCASCCPPSRSCAR